MSSRTHWTSGPEARGLRPRLLDHRIREASGGDAAILARLIRDSFRTVARRFDLTRDNCATHPSFCTKGWVCEALGRGVRFFVLEAEGRPRGCVALEVASRETCYLERLAVLPRSRRHGFGGALVRRVLDESKELGAREVGIAIIAEQEDLRAWYEALGFTAVQTRRFAHLPFTVLFMKRGV